MTMRELIRSLVPPQLRKWYRALKRSRQHARDATRTREAVFTEIYLTHGWGRSDSGNGFCSGSGTNDPNVAAAYVSMVTEQADREGFRGLHFVDLGCGDFRIGSQLLPLCSAYIGVDVVKPLVDSNLKQYGSETTRFIQLDIVNESLPNGDVCFLRQVLQHLSNQEVRAVLEKIRKYHWVFITEHYPTDDHGVEPNKDKVHGGGIRLYENSAIYLTKPPFSLPEKLLTQVLEVPAPGGGSLEDKGVLRTFLYKPA